MPVMQPILKREWFFPALLALFFVLVGSLPYVHGYRSAPPGEDFMGLIGRDTAGGNSYFAFARQSAEGNVGLTNLYTPHSPSQAYFNVEWWLMGATARATGLSLEVMFHLGRVVTALAFLLAAYYLCAVFLAHRNERRAALLLIAFGAGFGWIVWGANHLLGTALILPWDVQGVSPFAYLMNKPHFMRAGIFAALQYAWFIRGDQTGRGGFFCASGLAAAAHSFIRPYPIPESLVFLVLYVLARAVRNRADGKRAAIRAIACGLCQAPAVLWHARVYWNNELGLQGLHAWQPVLLLPQLLWFGLPLAAILADLFVVALRGRRWRPEFSVPVLWMIAAMLLLQAAPYFPFGVESYYPWVLAPPVLFMRHTWPAWVNGLNRRTKAPKGRAARQWVIACVVCLVVPSNLFAYADFFHDLRHPDPRERYYLPHDVTQAIAWLEANAPRESVVLAGHDSSEFIPRLAQLRVLAGQDALSANYAMMNEWVMRFFISPGDDGFKRWLCGQQNIAYVFIGPFEQEYAAMNPAEHGWLLPVYSVGTVTVYQVTQSG